MAIATATRLVTGVLSCALLATSCTAADDNSIGSAPAAESLPDTVTTAGQPTDSVDRGTGSSDTDDRPAAGSSASSGSQYEPTDWSTCSRVDVDGSAAVATGDLVETSGLAASQRHEGVVWAHNDSGSAAGVFAVGLNGDDQGFFALDGVDGTDIEDMALADGRIHLADIGDNNRRRETVEIHIFDEPVPTGAGSVETVPVVTSLTARYPDGPTDAEALLVDPLTGEILVFSKDLRDGDAPTRIYSIGPAAVNQAASDPAPSSPGEPVEMIPAGTIDVSGFDSQATEFSINAVLFPGLVTAADISGDGQIIALRTYSTVWLFKRNPDQTLVEALAGDPCEGGTAAESQGESVTFLPPVADTGDPGDTGELPDRATVRYVTVSEGTNPTINVVTVELS